MVFTVINRPLFGLSEYRLLQMKQEIIDRVFETNRESGFPCVMDGCSIRDLDGLVMVRVSWRVEEDGIWIAKSISFQFVDTLGRTPGTVRAACLP